MSTVFDSLLTEFAARHDATRAVTDADGRVVLLCDDQLVVNLISNDEGEVHALAQVGRLPRAGFGAAQDSAYGEEWLAHGHVADGFGWWTTYDPESGWVALVARAPTAQLDSVSFDAWLHKFVQRLRQGASVFSGVTPH